MKKIIAQSILIFVLLGTAFLSNAQSQTKTCDLQLDIFQSPNADSNESVRVEDVKATLTRLDTYKEKVADKSGSLPRFSLVEGYSSGLSQATYRVAVKKDGYKTMYKSFRLDCSKANEKNLISKTIFLLKGNSKEKIHLIDDGELQPIVEIGQVTYYDLILKLAPPSYYPPAAKAQHVGGAVLIVVGVDEQGVVAAAQAIKGHPLLMDVAVEAAKKSTFVPTLIDGKPAKVKALMVYNFVEQ